jgi:spermidine synthase
VALQSHRRVRIVTVTPGERLPLSETARMKPWELLGETRTPEGHDVRLTRQDGEYVILVDGKTLMSSRRHGSEDALATLTFRHLQPVEQPHVIVGGLGMGFTLRATLDLLPPAAIVTVVELLPAVIEWNRGPLGSLAGHPLTDPRVRIQVADVARTLRHSGLSRFDAILLDVDNGPAAFTAAANRGLYDNAGVAAAHAALQSGGVLAVWSARDDRKFEQRLRYHGFVVQVARVRARLKKGGPRHTIFLGVKSAGAAS